MRTVAEATGSSALREEIDMAHRIPNAELVLYEDARHGGILQCRQQFVPKALAFLGS